MLRHEGAGTGTRNGLKTRKCRRIQVISQIESHRAYRRFVAYTNSNGIGNVIVIALGRCTLLKTELRIFLPPVHQTVNHVISVSKDIPRVVKDCQAHIVLKIRKVQRRHPQFKIIEKQCAAAKRKTSLRVPGTSLIQAETSMRVSAACKKSLSQAGLATYLEERFAPVGR